MHTKAFDRIFIIMFENETVDAVRQNPYMLGLECRGVRLSQYFGVTHPSQPNYIASTCGAALVYNDDCQNVDATNIVDLLEAHNYTWKAYMEDLPEDKTSCSSGNYFRKHNPFVSYNNIQNNPKRMERIVNAGQLPLDLAADGLSHYSWYTPNIVNDGHSPQSVPDLAKWLEGFLEPLLLNPKFTEGTLIVLTFDESIPYLDNHIYTTLLGDMLTPGTTQSDPWDHYSLLRTIEENFNLGTLGRHDKTADYFRFLWNEGPPKIDLAMHFQPASEAQVPVPAPPAPPPAFEEVYALTTWNEIFQGVRHAVGVAPFAFGTCGRCTRIQHANILCVDLQAPGVSLVTTPQVDRLNGKTIGEVVTGFMTANPAVQVAINANFSWYTPAAGGFQVGKDYVLLGLAASGGKVVCDPTQPGWLNQGSLPDVPDDCYSGATALLIDGSGKASFQQVTAQQPLPSNIQFAVAGGPPPSSGFPPQQPDEPGPLMLLSGHTIKATASCSPAETIAARTGIGLDSTGRYLFLVTVDGREKQSPAYGAAFYDLAFWLKQAGASDGINLDGGGSTVMAIATQYGPMLLSTPYGDENSPGLQRPLGIFLGVVANSLAP